MHHCRQISDASWNTKWRTIGNARENNDVKKNGNLTYGDNLDQVQH